ncbi:signal recognition particle-docking protein FtsY [Candidatus Woesearchaeota archaeon]|nr:signal recognition particle-docking protein FtsY [Candidatus Woesearchaeota archaeon]
MFGFLKEKIKAGIKRLTGKIAGEPQPEPAPEETKKIPALKKPSEQEIADSDADSQGILRGKISELPKSGKSPAKELSSSALPKKKAEFERPKKEAEPQIPERKGESELQKGEDELPKRERGLERLEGKRKPEGSGNEGGFQSPEGKKESENIKKRAEPDSPRKQAEPDSLKEERDSEIPEKKSEPAEVKKGFFAKLRETFTEKVTTTTIGKERFEELFGDMEMSLLENNVAVEVIEKIKADLEKALVDHPIKRLKVEQTIQESLRSSLEDILGVPSSSFLERIKAPKPFIVCFFGINGSGKTTTIAKLAFLLKQEGMSAVIAAADTFRAASIDQLEHHGEALGVSVIKHGYGSDPAAVAFDAVRHAEAKGIDAVLIDTAGRMHSNKNLIDEMKKIIRVAKPHLKIFVGEALTGNDCVEQVKIFNEAVGIDAIILTKADVDEKGGAIISASFVSGKPILFLGVGQGYEDLQAFEKEAILAKLEI